MSDVDFIVKDVFDLEGRGGLLVVGDLPAGIVEAGTVLSEQSSGLPVHVLGLELHRSLRPPTVTLIVDREDSDRVQVGRHLVDERKADEESIK